jgi:hypothetical protein
MAYILALKKAGLAGKSNRKKALKKTLEKKTKTFGRNRKTFIFATPLQRYNTPE